MAATAQEKTEDATPKRRKDARKKGTVVKSIDLVGSGVLLAVMVAMPSVLSQLGEGMMKGIRLGLTEIPRDVEFSSLTGYFWKVSMPALPGLGFLMLVTFSVGIALTVVQTGLLVSAEAMKPTFEKVNPASGLKRIFSKNGMFETFKNTVKTAVFMWIVYSAIQNDWPRLANLSSMPLTDSMNVLGGTLTTIGFNIVKVWLALGIADYFFQRYQVNEQLKMTKDEVRREMKDAETSEEVRMQIAARRQKLTRNMAAAVKTADVVVTNPTHFAVAIKYESGKEHAPQVVAKGQDLMALKIRELATENNIPIVPNPPLARALYKQCDLGGYVPRDLFQPVAEVLAYVYKTFKKANAGVK